MRHLFATSQGRVKERSGTIIAPRRVGADRPELRLITPDRERNPPAVGRPRRLRLVRRIGRDLLRRAARERRAKHLEEPVRRGRDERDVPAVGRHAEPREIVLGRDLANQPRVAALARHGEDHVASRRGLRDHDEVRAVGQPFRVADLALDARHGQFARRTGQRAALLIDPDDEHRRRVGARARAVEQQPLAVRRPARPAGLGAAAEEAHARGGASAPPSARPQPHVVGLILVRMERDPLAVRRPAERLILRLRRVDDARRPSRPADRDRPR